MDLAEAQELLRRREATRMDVQRMYVPNLTGGGEGQRGGKTASTVYGEDVVVEMPPTVEQMLMNLGSNKRQQLGKYTRRLEREWPGGIEWLCLSKEQISEEIYRAVIDFNIQRQTAKGKEVLWEEEVVGQRWQLARETGLLCGIRLAGKLVAGGVACLHGEDAYFLLIGHDPKYDYWNLGNLTTWLAMEKSHEQGVRRFHFLWGISEYKLRFSGEVRQLYTVSVFRNHAVRMVSVLLDSVPAWRRGALESARNVRMAIRNSEFGRRISGLRGWLHDQKIEEKRRVV
ncbi:MAG TPA: GNAT family N-acetyltransferase [Candidatus Acidoferrum sp.]|nr:GNAT family N-acetyltransferase [Candidatus Acidoferrum sp.]